jgi:hypothetical protein
VGGSGLRSCPIAGFVISGAEPLGSTTRDLFIISLLCLNKQTFIL